MLVSASSPVPTASGCPGPRGFFDRPVSQTFTADAGHPSPAPDRGAWGTGTETAVGLPRQLGLRPISTGPGLAGQGDPARGVGLPRQLGLRPISTGPGLAGQGDPARGRSPRGTTAHKSARAPAVTTTPRGDFSPFGGDDPRGTGDRARRRSVLGRLTGSMASTKPPAG